MRMNVASTHRGLSEVHRRVPCLLPEPARTQKKSHQSLSNLQEHILCSLVASLRKGIALEQLCGEAVGNAQVVQPLRPPLTELQQQRRELLARGDHLLQQADGLSNTETKTSHPRSSCCVSPG